MVRVIYFDYYGVLDRRTFPGLLQAVAKASGQANLAQAAPDLPSLAADYMVGKVGSHEFWQRLEKDVGAAANVAGRKYMLHVDPVREMWEMLNELPPRYALGLCSDCAVDQKDVIRSAYSLPDFFDYIILSCDANLSKRDPAFYRLMLQNGMYRPEECLLVDDDEANTTLAAEQGFETHLFRSVDGFREFMEFKQSAPGS